jgi:hypothetical protein
LGDWRELETCCTGDVKGMEVAMLLLLLEDALVDAYRGWMSGRDPPLPLRVGNGCFKSKLLAAEAGLFPSVFPEGEFRKASILDLASATRFLYDSRSTVSVSEKLLPLLENSIPSPS